MKIYCDIKKWHLLLHQQAPVTITVITNINNYITQFRALSRTFSERSELILRGGENKP